MTVAARRDWPRSLQLTARLVSITIIIAALYFAQVVLIPIALAAFVTFLMSPLVTRLDRLGLPRVLAVIVVAGAATGLLGGVGYVVVGQLSELADELPAYRFNIREKLADLRALTRGGTLERVQTTIEDISEDVERDVEAEARARGGAEGADEAAEEEPVPVRIAEEPEIIGGAGLLSPVAQVAATAGLTMLLSIFMMIKREDLRNRLVSLPGQASLVVTTKAFAEAGRRISRYLLMQFVINATMGLAVGIGLFLIGVPYAVLWGLTAGVLRYIPYVGPWVGALLPIAVSVITAPGWEQVVIVVALFVTLELLSNNVMEPLLYGQSVGLSPIAVIVSAIFWTWIWGPIGLVLATPMTACLVVLSRYIPELGIFDRLLSERPALQPHLWLYQRLLARDEDEAEDIVEAYAEEHTLAETCEGLLLGTLLALKRDLADGHVLPDDGEFVANALREIIEDLPGRFEASLAAGAESTVVSAAAHANGQGRAPASSDEPLVLLIGFPVRDKLDGIALELLAVILREEHCKLEILSPDMLIGERIAEVEARRPAAVVVPSLPPGDLTETRHACRRLRAQEPGLPVVVGRLGTAKSPERNRELLRAAGARHVAMSLEGLHERLRPIIRDARGAPSAAEPAADAETVTAR